MNFIDLCSGIGGFRLGFERAGMKCVGFCEIDKFARKSYEAMYDTKGEWKADDITEVTDEEIGELKNKGIDVIVGGFPCQAFSVAGKRKGFSDTRGTIFFEVLRFIRIINPRTFVCENVKGLLSHDGGRTFGTIISALAELGYCVEWQILNSKNFGVPQSRERVFLVGHLGDECGRKIFPIFGTSGENPCELQEITKGVADSYRIYNSGGIARTLKSEGGGLGAKMGLYTDRALCTIEKPVGTKGGVSSFKLRNVGAKEATTVAARYYKGLSADGCNAVISGIDLTENDPRLTDVARCLQARYVKGTVSTRPREATGVFDGVRIRRLTPRECWRLQGFPDEYFERAKAAGVSETQLYKQAGNAVTVNVAEAIGKEIVKRNDGCTSEEA